MKLRSKMKTKHESIHEEIKIQHEKERLWEPIGREFDFRTYGSLSRRVFQKEERTPRKGLGIKIDAELLNNVTTIEELKSHCEFSRKEENQLRKIIERHPMSVTPYYLSLIDWDDPYDPIRKMAIPSVHELDLSGSYDTSGERENTKMLGLQHKYSQTALILLTNKCAMYCRHCFRKRLVGLSNEEILERFSDAKKYVESHQEINNVLVSGGDPFALPTRTIRRVLDGLSSIKHLDFIRFGTRIPVTYPMRITEDESFVKMLNEYSVPNQRVYIVTQFNHPREITTESSKAVSTLIKHDMIVNNQSVLLKGVNDDPRVLASLQNKLVGIGVNPYYVFQCRPVKRVKENFQLPIFRGIQIVEDAKKLLNGHSKRFKFVLSHKTGKIEIIGIIGDEIYFKYHQAKNPRNHGKFFKRKINNTAGWLDDLSSQTSGNPL